jgi:fatty acid desaturase
MFPPLDAPSAAELSTKIDAAAARTDATISSAQDTADTARTVAIVAVLVAVVAIVLAILGWRRAGRSATA